MDYYEHEGKTPPGMAWHQESSDGMEHYNDNNHDTTDHSKLNDRYTNDDLEARFAHSAAAAETRQSSSSSGLVGCDRRLSRAARSLLERHLRSIVSLPEGTEGATVWQLLGLALPQFLPDDSKCPLLPARDMLRHDEEHSIVLSPPPRKSSSRIGVSIRTALYQQPKRIWQTRPWYQCGLCLKMFSSRFYLDRHLDRKHSHSERSKDSICPATEWCPALPFCSQQALELEPYYGPGSDGLSPYDRFDVHRALWKEAHSDLNDSPCDEEEMQRSKHLCYEMMQQCFPDRNHHQSLQGDILRHQLEQSLCEKISCPDRLHQLFFSATSGSNEAAAMMMKHVHEWQDEWSHYYAQHHELGWMGGVLLTGLAMWYIRQFVTARQNRGTSKLLRRNDQKGTRLLQKHSNNTSILGRARKRYEPSKTKKH